MPGSYGISRSCVNCWVSPAAVPTPSWFSVETCNWNSFDVAVSACGLEKLLSEPLISGQ